MISTICGSAMPPVYVPSARPPSRRIFFTRFGFIVLSSLRLLIHHDLEALVRERDELEDLHRDFLLLRVLRHGHAAAGRDRGPVDDLAVDLGTRYETEARLAGDDRLLLVADALARRRPRIE